MGISKYYYRLRFAITEFLDDVCFSSDSFFVFLRLLLSLCIFIPLIFMVFHVQFIFLPSSIFWGVVPSILSFYFFFKFISSTRNYTLLYASTRKNQNNKKGQKMKKIVKKRNVFQRNEKRRFRYDLNNVHKKSNYLRKVKIQNKFFWSLSMWNYNELSKLLFFFMNPLVVGQCWILWVLENSRQLFIFKVVFLLMMMMGGLVYYYVFQKSEENRKCDKLIFDEQAFLERKLAETWEDSRIEAEKQVFKDFFRRSGNGGAVHHGDNNQYQSHLNDMLDNSSSDVNDSDDLSEIKFQYVI